MAGDFNTGDPLAYFLTWTTYGTWLPGDARGWRRRQEPGVTQPPNRLFAEMAASELQEPPFFLAPSDLAIAERAITKHCQVRSWMLHKVSVLSNHIHVVVTAPQYAPKKVCVQFKAWCTHQLKPNYPTRKYFWTRGGYHCCLNNKDALESAIQYVQDQ